MSSANLVLVLFVAKSIPLLLISQCWSSNLGYFSINFVQARRSSINQDFSQKGSKKSTGVVEEVVHKMEVYLQTIYDGIERFMVLHKIVQGCSRYL